MEKEFLSVSLYLDHPPIFFYSMCSLVTQQEKCYLHSRIKSWGGLQLWREPLRVNRRGVVSELPFSEWFFSAWGGGGRAPLSLVSWMGTSVFFRFIQDSLRSAFAYQVVATDEYLCSDSCSKTILYNWPLFWSEQFLKPPLDLVNPQVCQLICHISTNTWSLFAGCLSVEVPISKQRPEILTQRRKKPKKHLRTSA